MTREVMYSLTKRDLSDRHEKAIHSMFQQERRGRQGGSVATGLPGVGNLGASALGAKGWSFDHGKWRFLLVLKEFFSVRFSFLYSVSQEDDLMLSKLTGPVEKVYADTDSPPCDTSGKDMRDNSDRLIGTIYLNDVL
jgi:hypothetical protein